MPPHFNVYIIGFEEIWAATWAATSLIKNRVEEQGFFPYF